MNEITDLTMYRNKAYLELCLTLVEEAYQECSNGNYDMAKELLSDILETFDIENVESEEVVLEKNVLSFPSTHK
jgi:hypothetical protein